MSALGDLTKKVRSLPLDEILKSYGFELRREGLSWRAKNEGYNIVFRGERWFDNASGVGGGGAIDLVKYLTGVSFAETVKSLAGKFIANRNPSLEKFVEREIEQELRESFESLIDRFGKRDDSQWERARQYLIEERALDSRLIDQLYKEGKIYANNHRPNPSIVFLHTDLEGNVKGATLRDTKHQSSFRPSLGDKKSAWFTVGNLSQAQLVVVTESPIDALSYHCLNKSSRKLLAIVSIAGTHISDELLEYVQKNNKGVIVALDSDHAGEKGVDRIKDRMESYGRIYRHSPQLKDWNEDLCFQRKRPSIVQYARRMSL